MIREISIINHLLKKEIEYKEKLENELSGAEYGSLCIKHRKNRITFEEYNNGELKWLNKKSLKIYQIAHYNKAGYKQHRNLICTWEDDIEDMSNLDEIICRFILKV